MRGNWRKLSCWKCERTKYTKYILMMGNIGPLARFYVKIGNIQIIFYMEVCALIKCENDKINSTNLSNRFLASQSWCFVLQVKHFLLLLRCSKLFDVLVGITEDYFNKLGLSEFIGRACKLYAFAQASFIDRASNSYHLWIDVLARFHFLSVGSVLATPIL